MKWRSTKTSLPEEGKSVLIWFKSGEIVSGKLTHLYDGQESYWETDMFDFADHSEYELDRVKAWAPYPHAEDIEY